LARNFEAPQTRKETIMTTLKKILVVDDDPVVTKSFDRVLSNKGYAVITAANGEEALKKIAAEDYDLVYTDIKMPGMDGIEVASRIKSNQPWLPVVIVTGYGSDENVARAKAAGVSRVLHKPLSPEMIEGSVHEAALAERTAELPAAAETAPAPVVTPAAVEPEPRKGGALRFARNLALFVAAPLVGLAYVMAFPLIGLGLIAWHGAGAVSRRSPRLAATAKRAGLFAAAPFVGLAYTVVLPFVGLGMLLWMCGKPLFGRAGRE
jgi:CheY-like chemotaxis protein